MSNSNVSSRTRNEIGCSYKGVNLFAWNANTLSLVSLLFFFKSWFTLKRSNFEASESYMQHEPECHLVRTIPTVVNNGKTRQRQVLKLLF